MSLLFFGYFLLLLRYDLTIAGFTFDILLDFAGYLILAKAAVELATESDSLKKTAMVCKAMALVAFAVPVLLFVLDMPAVEALVVLAADLAKLLILYLQIKGVSEIEKQNNYDMKGHKLRRDWMILALALLFTRISFYPAIAIVASYVNLIFSVLLLLDLNTAIKAYNGKVVVPEKEETPTLEKKTPEIAYIATEEDDG